MNPDDEPELRDDADTGSADATSQGTGPAQYAPGPRAPGNPAASKGSAAPTPPPETRLAVLERAIAEHGASGFVLLPLDSTAPGLFADALSSESMSYLPLEAHWQRIEAEADASIPVELERYTFVPTPRGMTPESLRDRARSWTSTWAEGAPGFLFSERAGAALELHGAAGGIERLDPGERAKVAPGLSQRARIRDRDRTAEPTLRFAGWSHARPPGCFAAALARAARGELCFYGRAPRD